MIAGLANVFCFDDWSQIGSSIDSEIRRCMTNTRGGQTLWRFLAMRLDSSWAGLFMIPTGENRATMLVKAGVSIMSEMFASSI
jgi:hypothetical protein